MKRSIGTAMLVIALAGFATLAEAQTASGPPPHYAVINLGTLGGSQSNGYGGVTNRRMGERGFLPDGRHDRACLCLARRRHDRPRHGRRTEQQRAFPRQGRPWPGRGSGARFPDRSVRGVLGRS